MVLAGCGPSPSSNDPSPRNSSEEISFNVIGDLEVKYARNFWLDTDQDGETLVVLFDGDTLRYVLHGEGQGKKISVPAGSMICLSSTHVGMLDALGKTDLITGISGVAHVYHEEVLRKAREGMIAEVAPHGKVNVERVMQQQPDLLLTNGLGALDQDHLRTLEEVGTKVMVNADWQETHPLGKAEWIKVIGILTGRLPEAKTLFRKVETRYNKLKDNVVALTGEKPKVICNLSYKGAWFMPGGNSYMAKYLENAGADYPWKDNDQQGGLRLGFEEVYAEALDADVWINPGTASSLEELRSMDERLNDLQVMRTGRVYNNTRLTRPEGGNAYWESGVVRPDKVLADLISICHPQALPGPDLVYFEKLPDER